MLRKWRGPTTGRPRCESGAAYRGIVESSTSGPARESCFPRRIRPSARGASARVPPRRRRALFAAAAARLAERVPERRLAFFIRRNPRISLSGVVVCYELFDALPVRALFLEGEKLLERVVTLGPTRGRRGASHGAAPNAPDGAELLDRFRAGGIHLLRNQRLEVRPGAASLASALGGRLSSGLLLVFDYGAPAKALYSGARANGTLEAFVSPTASRVTSSRSRAAAT